MSKVHNHTPKISEKWGGGPAAHTGRATGAHDRVRMTGAGNRSFFCNFASGNHL